jgi:mRNA-degrading endonuclease RelE of RelBE toxin-antitoxin system
VRNIHLQLTKSAADDLDHIAEDQREKILNDVRVLSSSSRSPQTQIKKLKGFKPPLYRLRSGDYRVLFQMLGDRVIIMRVISRRDLDRIIKRIKL